MKSVLILLCLVAGAAAAEDTTVTSLMTRDLTGIAGKEGSMVTVEYAPGASSTAHRHNAYTFVYVLEGSVVMQVKGGKEVTLGPGQTFYLKHPGGPAVDHIFARQRWNRPKAASSGCSGRATGALI